MVPPKNKQSVAHKPSDAPEHGWYTYVCVVRRMQRAPPPTPQDSSTLQQLIQTPPMRYRSPKTIDPRSYKKPHQFGREEECGRWIFRSDFCRFHHKPLALFCYNLFGYFRPRAGPGSLEKCPFQSATSNTICHFIFSAHRKPTSANKIRACTYSSTRPHRLIFRA